MKKIYLGLLLVTLAITAQAQAPHLYEHTYPTIQEEDVRIRALMEQVSKDSLQATIERLQAFPTRRWDSQMVYKVENWLFNTYSKMGFDTVFSHDFQFMYHDTLRETSDNVIAIQRGVLYPDEYVVCGAHYDSYNNSPGHPDSLLAPGADDNASGSSGIIETARILRRCTFERSIMYCGWAAEEANLRGSAAFAKDCADQMLDIVGYFNLDMTGYLEEGSDMHVNLMYTTQDSLIGRYVINLSRVYYPEMRIWQDWLPWGDSDYSSFNRNGYPAVHPFEDVRNCSPWIHSVNDVLGVSVNNMDQVKRFAELNLGLVATLAGLVSNGVVEEDTERLVVYPNPTNDFINIKGGSFQQVELYNLLGQQVKKETCHGSEVQMDVASLAAGVYLLRVTDDAMNVHSHRVVIY